MVNRARIPKAADIVVAAIRHDIVSEQFGVGERLPSENDLAVKYGLGRVTVREAVRVLERDGLLEVRRGRTGGIFVRHADAAQVSESLALIFDLKKTTVGQISEFRLLLEPQTTKLAAIEATPAQRVEFRRLATDGSGANATHEIHMLIGEASKNDVFEIIQLATIELALTRSFRSDTSRDRPAQNTRAEHDLIAQLVANGDAASAEEAMRNHLTHFIAHLKDRGFYDMPLFTSTSPQQPRSS